MKQDKIKKVKNLPARKTRPNNKSNEKKQVVNIYLVRELSPLSMYRGIIVPFQELEGSNSFAIQESRFVFAQVITL